MAQSREERLRKKREAEKRRYERLKQDPEGALRLKEKEKVQYAAKKKKGIIKPIDKCSPRQQRLKRKQWRQSSLTYRTNCKLKLQQRTLLEHNSPPDSEAESLQDAETLKTSASRRRANKLRKQRSRENRKKDKTISKLKRKVEKLKKRNQRLKKKIKSSKEDLTPNKRVDLIMKNKEAHTIRKTLLFAEVMKDQIVETKKIVKSKKEKQFLRIITTGSLVKKYRIKHYFPRYFESRHTKRVPISTRNRKLTKAIVNHAKLIVKDFLEDDAHSRMAAGKKECITRHKVKKQKRYLNDTMKNLHKDFLRSNPSMVIGYSTFCKFKPFWVKASNVTNRDTCKCMICGNMEFLADCLNRIGVLAQKSLTHCKEIFCCTPQTEECLLRKCVDCPHPDLTSKLPSDCAMIRYFKWVYLKEKITIQKTGKEKVITKVAKTPIVQTPNKALDEFLSSLEQFLMHQGRIKHQYCHIKSLKKSLKEDECIVHMDFSENYNLKHAEEVQAFHFGGSRKQISLHTVVAYVKQAGKENASSISFCTMSESLNHEVPGIWGHLTPVLRGLQDKFQFKKLHFVSDSPSGQYRNKTMFYFLANHLLKICPGIISFTWNYLEAGHGKGAADGIGAVCKRTADRMVREGKDVGSLNDLDFYLKANVKGVTFFVISEKDIDNVSKMISPKDIHLLKGTMKVHQVLSKESLGILEFRDLSYFDDKPHSNIGTLNYSLKKSLKTRSIYNDVYSDDESISEPDVNERSPESIENFAFSAKDIINKTHILVELKDESNKKHKTIFKYAAVTTDDMDEDGDVNVCFFRVVDNKEAQLFRLDSKDRSSINFNEIKCILKEPDIVRRGRRVFYRFRSHLDIFEK